MRKDDAQAQETMVRAGALDALDVYLLNEADRSFAGARHRCRAHRVAEFMEDVGPSSRDALPSATACLSVSVSADS